VGTYDCHASIAITQTELQIPKSSAEYERKPGRVVNEVDQDKDTQAKHAGPSHANRHFPWNGLSANYTRPRQGGVAI